MGLKRIIELILFQCSQEIVQDKLYFAVIRRADVVKQSRVARNSLIFSIDNEFIYEPFFADFGPLNLGMAYRFCQKLNQLLAAAEQSNKKVYFYTVASPQFKANAAVLIGIHQVLFNGQTSKSICQRLQKFRPYPPFRDASCGTPLFHLRVEDVIKGIEKAKTVGFIQWGQAENDFDINEYEKYEQVENGDINWIIPNKFLAFSGPQVKRIDYGGFYSYVPEDYWDYFRKKSVSGVIRLNKKLYDGQRFARGGFDHYELYFPDGSCPQEPIINRFFKIVESDPGAFAIHCKAGLGRTGTLICLYMMKHYRFTAEEAIGYIRVCRPGSVIGPQQLFLKQQQERMWAEGTAHLTQGLKNMSIKADANDKADSSRTPSYGAVSNTDNLNNKVDHGISKQNITWQNLKGQADYGSSRSRPVSTTASQMSDYRQNMNAHSQGVRPSTGLTGMGRSSSQASRSQSAGRHLFEAKGFSSSSSRGLSHQVSGILHQDRKGWQAQQSSSPYSNYKGDLDNNASSGTSVGRLGVTRTLAPNGQPRKVPTNMIRQASAGTQQSREDKYSIYSSTIGNFQNIYQQAMNGSLRRNGSQKR